LPLKKNWTRNLRSARKKIKSSASSHWQKVRDVLEDPYRFKPLRKPLHNKRGVHIGGSFVLIDEANAEKRMAAVLDFDHHDNVYTL